ncbi:pyrimidine/purine nucleoside phosphorylase [bacterium]|nr:pyrimidine/purine nucleoside phosphorylase [bacterium]
MMNFEKVTVVKKANIYYDGKVSSRIVKFADGSVKTLGVMLPGEYHFSTNLPEVMDIMAGKARYRIKGSDKWMVVKEGEAFNVPGDSSFDIVVEAVLDYCCSFVKE